MLHIGCCGFPVGLSGYSRELLLAEVQKTFYRIPKEETVRRWRAAVPEDFTFTVKAWQGITHPAGSPTYRRSGLELSDAGWRRLGHFQPTEPVFQGWEETRTVANILKAPLILLQAPPSFHQTGEHERDLKAFFSGINRGDERLAIELRSPWDRSRIGDICRDLNLIHCVDPFKEVPVSGPPFYLRLHGSPPGKRMYAYRYTADDLRWLQARIEGWEAEGEVYCLFNNLSMWQDSRAFRDLWLGTAPGGDL